MNTFESTVLPYRDRLFYMASELTRDPADAHDLVQETLIRAFTRYHLLREEGATLYWLRRILKNQFLNRCDSQRRESGNVSLDTLTEAGLDPVCGEVAPERHAVNRDEADAVRRVIHSLPSPYRETMTCAVSGDYSYDEIAERTGVPKGTVRARIHRGRKMAQNRLHELGYTSA